MQCQTRSSGDVLCNTRDIFFYKRKDIPTWKGPGTVTGQNRQQILIKHGPTYVRVRPCNTQLKNIDKTVLIYKMRIPGMMKLSLATKLS